MRNFKAIKELNSVALVELDPDRAFADTGDTVGEEFLALAVLLFLYEEILVSQEVFGLADRCLGSG
ncbi:MAG: hypothetical protein NTZ92_06965 [Candidatus Omnitrophica bacterium]|nr:hypothetical protein [Candidatus Omnitrophota bacterium]